MKRVSTDMSNNDTQYWLRRKEVAMADIETKIARQTRIPELRSDPLAAAHAVKYESFAARLARFEKNAVFAQDVSAVAEGYSRQAQDVMQRLREIAVQGANGVYTKEDSSYMAAEVNELLKELVSIANSRGPDGRFMFAGDKVTTEPFRALRGFAGGTGEEQVIGVEYLGSTNAVQAEITQDAYVPLGVPGNQVFWGEQSAVFSTFDASGYRVLAPSAIRIDGHEIELKPGDTLHAVIAKINASGAPVKASVDPERNSLVIETTTPHELWLEEGKGGRVFTDLGVLRDPAAPPPANLAPTARVAGGSMFDAVISLRDALYRGDNIEVGGRVMASVDAAMDNLNLRVAEFGARSERLEQTRARLNKEIPDVVKLQAEAADLDMAQAIMDLRMAEYAKNAALGTAGRVLPVTLLDFLR
ncbi:MAG: flagellar hook-associated protein 3 [Spirochaetes bacterium]|nr:flagellar hook-associated protein 3 [Spirochaetota bacterium]